MTVSLFSTLQSKEGTIKHTDMSTKEAKPDCITVQNTDMCRVQSLKTCDSKYEYNKLFW